MKSPSPSAVPKGAMMWDAHAPIYEQVWERTTTLWGRDAIILGQLPSTTAYPAPRFLDVACGTGALAMAAASMGFDVTATDYSAGMISRLQAKLASSDLQITKLVTDGQTLEGLDDASFDVVSSNFGIFMFPDRAAAWRSVWRVLKPGGRLLATSWDVDSVNLRLARYIMENATDKENAPVQDHHKQALSAAFNRMQTVASFREELEEFGFGDIRIVSTSHPMCFQSGQEFVRARATGGPKDEASLARCSLDFFQCELSGVDPSSAEGKALARKSADAPIEDHPLWSTPFAVQALGHIAIATKHE